STHSHDTASQHQSRTQLSAAAQARAAGHHHCQTRQSRQPRQQQGGYGSHSPAVAAIARENAAKRAKQPFELSLGNATLLEKRRRMHGLTADKAATTVGTPPSQAPTQSGIQV
ncbi:hypothetical protein KEM54_004888, partial [Ascosphaera aggregata]